MNKGIYTALSGSIIQERRLDIISNNLANLNSIAYKGDLAVFESYLPHQKDVNIQSNIPKAANTQVYVIQSNPYIDFSQGPLIETTHELDLALDGDGFFVVETPDGIRYTRSGNFKIGAESILITQEGYPVLGGMDNEIGERIFINLVSVAQRGEISISPDGMISVIDQFSGDLPLRLQKAYKLKIVDFQKPYKLKKEGDGLYAPLDKGIKEFEVKNAIVKQGFLEQSNINTIKEMTSMIEVIRGYESYQKVIQSFSDSASKMMDEVGRAV
jgi:flagellar basal-body rod protein FlgG